MDPPHAASNDGDATTQPTTTTKGSDTQGKLNAKPEAERTSLSVGIAEDKGKRRTMEDAHSFVYDFAGVRGQGFFAVFDGHAGKDAAEWCGFHFHEELLNTLAGGKFNSIPDTLNQTFHVVDGHLSQRSEESDGKLHSGCTAVTAFLRLEDRDGKQAFLPSSYTPTASAGGDSKKAQIVEVDPKTEGLRRVLYCANAGDARGVLCRGGKAVRLTYDHKGSDKQEAKRITDAGGFMLGGRVNGVLAVTRSLGDSAMKDYVVGAPYTTETELCEEDEFMIIACDGLWDIASDQQAVHKIRAMDDAQAAAQVLVDYALRKGSQDNVSVIVVRLRSVPEEAKNAPAQNSDEDL